MIEHLDNWLAANHGRLNQLGYSGSITRDDGHVEKAAAWIDLESPRALAQIILWETGEADLRVGLKGSEELTLNEHRIIATREDLDTAMDALVSSL